MNNDKKPLYYMILWSIVRHGLQFIGVWALAHHWISQDLLDKILSGGTETVVAWILTLGPIVWAVFQKTQVWGWVLTALHVDPKKTAPGDIPKTAPGPNIPL